MEEQPNQTISESIPVRPQITSDIIKWLITGDDISEQIEVELTGKKVYNGKLVVVNPYKKRLINDEGINAIKVIVTSHIGKGVISSNLTEDEIYRIYNDVWLDVDDKIFQMHEEWEIKEVDCSSIRACIVNNVFFALKRAISGERELDIWGRAVKHTQINSSQPQKKSGFFGWMGFK